MDEGYPDNFRVYTETGSIHEIDMKSGTYVRLMRGGMSGELRRDGETIPIVRCTRPEVGEPLVLVLRIREDGVLTNRMTSLVTRIEERDQ